MSEQKLVEEIYLKKEFYLKKGCMILTKIICMHISTASLLTAGITDYQCNHRSQIASYAVYMRITYSNLYFPTQLEL